MAAAVASVSRYEFMISCSFHWQKGDTLEVDKWPAGLKRAMKGASTNRSVGATVFASGGHK